MILRLLSAGALFLLFLPASADTALEKVERAGVIRLGVANEVPFGYLTADGKLDGEAPAIARKILEQIDPKLRIEGIVVEFGDLIEALQDRRIDVIAAGMFITPERCKEVAFSRPTYKIGEALLVKAGNPKNLTDLESIANKPEARLAVMAGAVEYGYAYEAGVTFDQVSVLLNYPEALSELKTGSIDAIAMTSLTARTLAKDNPAVTVTQQFFPIMKGEPVAGYGAFAFRKEDTDLLAAFNEHLADFIGSEGHWQTVREFGFTEETLPDKTVEALCEG